MKITADSGALLDANFSVATTDSGFTTNSRTFAIYLGSAAEVNFQISRPLGIWGFSERLMARSRASLERFNSIEPGDTVIFARAPGGGARTPEHVWPTQPLADVRFCTVVSTTTAASDTIWPSDKGEVFPFRFAYELLREVEAVAPGDVPPDLRAALRTSGTGAGSGQPVQVSGSVRVLDLVAVDAPIDDTIDGELDRVVTGLRRAEQTRIRQLRLGATTSAACELCGKIYPNRILRMAHIKARADCDDAERRDWQNNIMVTCVVCDLLFERGDLIVEPDGTVAAGTLTPMTDDLSTLIATRIGRTCDAHGEGSAKYFATRRSGLSPVSADAGRRRP